MWARFDMPTMMVRRTLCSMLFGESLSLSQRLLTLTFEMLIPFP